MSDEQQPVKPAPTKEETPEKETVVIAEDSLPNQKILQHLLLKLGYTVIACNNGAEAWATLTDPATKNVVAILSDMMMPEEDGMTLLKKVRADDRYLTTPFIFISAISDKEQIVQAKALKIHGYILKPVTFQRVRDKMQDLFPAKNFPKFVA